MVSIDLSRHLYIVTGAAGGIGGACVEMLVDAGATVVALDINSERLGELYDSTDAVHHFSIDLRNPLAVTTLFKRIEVLIDESHPRDNRLELRGLVHCAGLISYRKGVGAVPDDEWDTVMETNVRSAFLLCRECMGLMRQGSIVLFSSLAALVGGIEVGIHYTASKAALIGFARTLAKEAGPKGIRVNALAPGIIGTRPVLEQIGDHKAEYEASIPMGRIGEPEDVARAVLYLCSDLSSYVTGQTISINGGIYMG